MDNKSHRYSENNQELNWHYPEASIASYNYREPQQRS